MSARDAELRRGRRVAVGSVAGALLVSLAAAACADTGRVEVEVPLYVAGSDVSQPFEASGGVPVTLERVELAFGPFYLCAGAQAGSLCETARLEWLESVAIDATDPGAVRAGTLSGVSGRVRSWMYDLGLSSVLTRQSPLVLPAAEALGGVSLVLEGRADVAGTSVAFRADVPIQQSTDTEPGVPVVRKGTTEVFDHEVTASEPGLLVRFDPRSFVEHVEFAAFVADETCESGGPELACSGALELTCGADGSVQSSRDCADPDGICISGRGCTEQTRFEADGAAFRAVRNAVLGARPAFEWGFSP